mmetsp:Transcript_14460/g.31346  ORF Transcript_14460/g.31346 Transcript_14460/m.31346 type:complete len:201 (+) Transcript_14460:1153-1755(+)
MPKSSAASWSRRRKARCPLCLSMAVDTTSRVANSLTKRLPSELMSTLPTPRNFSGHNHLVPESGSLGSRKPVGWICTCSRCTSLAPAPSAMDRASPCAQSPLVVARPAAVGLCTCSMVLLAAKPPVARMSASQRRVLWVLSLVELILTPLTRPPSMMIPSSLLPSMMRTSGSCWALRPRACMMARPTLGPTGLLCERGTE